MDTGDTKLSIIVSVYNMEKYISRCLDSIVAAINKTEDLIEVLIIDDGSQDNSRNIIEEYRKEYSYMHLYSKKNGGLSDTKNFGLTRAIGTYVIFIDSDDYIDSNMLCVMLDQLNDTDADIAVCGFEMVYDDSRSNYVPININSVRDDVFSNLIDTDLACASCNKMVKRELYHELSFPKGMNNEDVAVTPILMAKANRIVYVDRPFYKYYQRIGSIQNSEFNEKRFVMLETVRICIERADDLDPNVVDIIKGALYSRQVLPIAYYLIRRQSLKRRYMLLKEYMRRVNEYFPDIWQHPWVSSRYAGERIHRYIFRAISNIFLKRKQYAVTSIFWGFVNTICE